MRRDAQTAEQVVARPGAYVVDPSSGCWVWTASVNLHGYGQVNVCGRKSKAHRVFFETLRGPVQPGLVLDHLCRNRRCVNPDHLEPVTNRENILRGVSRTAANAAKSRCDHGHEFSDTNTYRDADGWRTCRTCKRLAQAGRRAAALHAHVAREASS